MGYRDYVPTDDFFFDDNEQEEALESVKWRDLTLFLIDASPGMLLAHPLDAEGRSCLQIALSSVLTLLERKLTRSTDKLGILLYGTKETRRVGDMAERPGIYALLDIQVPDVQDINRLEKLVKSNSIFLAFGNQYLYTPDATDAERIDVEIGSSSDYLLSDAFWAAMNMFDKFKKLKEASRRVFLITNDDNPNASTRDAQRVARNRAKDLKGNGIELGIFGLQRLSQTPFRMDLFYASLSGIAPEDWEGEEIHGTLATDPTELLDNLALKEKHRKTSFRIPFTLAPGLELGVKGVYLVSSAKKPNPVYLEEKSNQRVETVTNYTSAATGEILEKEEIKAAYNYGGKQAVFETREIERMKNFGDSVNRIGLVLLGFKPRDTLKFKFNLRNSCFITPNEEAYKGSTCLFSNLVQVLIEKNQIGIARLIALKRSLPRLVAMLPQVPSSINDSNPVGFHLIYLPFADDLRHIDQDLAPTGKLVSQALVEDMKLTIDELALNDFVFPNPELGKFYAGVRSVALDLDEMEDVIDETVPRMEWIHKAAGSHLTSLNQKLDTIAPQSKKRAAIGDTESVSDGKRVKGSLTLEQVQAAHSSGRLKAFTVPQLKEFLLSQGLKKPATKKDDLLAQVSQLL